MKTINLYNNFHYGDIFMSRIILGYLSQHFRINFHHNLNRGLLKDLENVEETTEGNKEKMIVSEFKVEDFYNTWIGIFTNSFANYDSYLKILKMICDDLSIELPSNYEGLPRINYDRIDESKRIFNILKNIKEKYEKIILVSTGNVLSNQSQNFDFTPLITDLSKKYNKYFFIITSNLSIQNENVLYTEKITDISPDLLEISYISKFCDVIIGRTSGPYTYCLTEDNLKDSNKTFICFCNHKIESIITENYLCKLVWTNNYNYDNMMSLIESSI